MQKCTLLINTLLCLILFCNCTETKQISNNNTIIQKPGTTIASKYTEWFFLGKTDSLYAALNERGRKRFPTPQGLADLRNDVVSVLPGFKEHLRDSVVITDTLVSVWQYGINSRDGAVYYVKWRLTPADNKIIGFSASDAGWVANTSTTNYRSKTKLHLPFEGDWIVFWGGKTVQENYHAAYPNQRFAMDLMPASDSIKIIRAAKGEAFQLTDFAGFGAPILAPADGRVLIAVDNIDDNPIGKFHPTSQSGNHLVIDHGNGEYSYLAHLRKGSITVKVGDTVKQGVKVAECGNSGRTTAPHLHYDLINSSQVAGSTLSLPAVFYNYYTNGVLTDKGEPKRWQVIKRATSN